MYLKSILTLFFFITLITNIISQLEDSNKKELYFYWGWNRGWYSNSNINFSGENYDFVLKNVIAKDRQTKFSFNNYFKPSIITIPQYNFRLGYYFQENWDISFGVDHMKYVVQQNQTVLIDGYIENTPTVYNNQYSDEKIELTKDFLKFEHTDGLNYINIEFRHSDEIIDTKNIRIGLKEGLGIGIMIPKTNTTLLGRESYDEFHLSGIGIDGIIALNFTLFNKFFIQPEFKAGFINLSNVRTSAVKIDKANHHFFFAQLNCVFGGTFTF